MRYGSLGAPPFILVLLLVGCGMAAPGASPRAEQPSPSLPLPTPSETEPPPMATIPPEIVDAIRMRESLGLRSDVEWVLAVAELPEAVVSEGGFLVTPAEDAELRRRFDGQGRLDGLIAYGAENADTFGGLYIDQAAGGVVVLLFTDDLERHANAVAGLAPPGLRVQLKSARYSEAELVEIVEGIDFGALRAEGYEVNSAGVDTIANVVRIEAKSNLPNARARLEERFGGKVVADIYPLPGPWQNREAGDGWRLLAAGRTDGHAYTVRVATDESSWAALWDELALDDEPPAVDFASELVALFGHGIGSSCPEVRLDDVVLDTGASVVYSVTSDPLAPRACTADLVGAAVFVVALSRDAVPASPFVVQLRDRVLDCEECAERVEVDLGD